MHSDYKSKACEQKAQIALNLRKYYLKKQPIPECNKLYNCHLDTTAESLLYTMPSPSQYTASTPADDLVPKSILNFFERLYKSIDTASQHEEFANCFTKDAVIVFASSRYEGRKGKIPT